MGNKKNLFTLAYAKKFLNKKGLELFKKSNQTKMMIGYLNFCIKTDAHFVTVMEHLCGFGEVFVRLWVWSLYGHSAVCMRLQCGVCAILVHYNTVFVRLRCDFAFGAALS